MKPALLLPLALALMLAAALLPVPPAQAAGEGVAVVNMVQLITRHPRAVELQRKLEQREQEAQTYADQEDKSLRNLKQAIELLTRNSPERLAKEKEFLTQSAMLKLEIEWRKDQALREYMGGLENLYREIQALVATFAREQGLKLVLLKSDAELRASDFNDYAAKVQLRGVVYSEPAMDITDQIQARFMPRPPGPGPVPPGGSPPPVAPPGPPPAGGTPPAPPPPGGAR